MLTVLHVRQVRSDGGAAPAGAEETTENISRTLPESQGHNLALTLLYVPHSLDSRLSYMFDRYVEMLALTVLYVLHSGLDCLIACRPSCMLDRYVAMVVRLLLALADFSAEKQVPCIYLSIRCILGDIRLWVGDPSSRRVERIFDIFLPCVPIISSARASALNS